MIDNVVVTKKRFAKIDFADKLIGFIYSTLIDFAETDKVKSLPMSKNFIENLKGIMKNKTHTHHSHISGEIIGYGHSYCNLKVRENQTKISVVAHNLLRFDFCFLLKGLRAGVWKTRDVAVSGKNPTNISLQKIRNRVAFIDTIKYFQQSLGKLASSLTGNEKLAILTECKKFMENYKIFSKNFNSCTKEDQEWVLDYLSTTKGTIPYEMITRYDSLDISSDNGNFFLPHNFYSGLKKDNIMTLEEY